MFPLAPLLYKVTVGPSQKLIRAHMVLHRQLERGKRKRDKPPPEVRNPWSFEEEVLVKTILDLCSSAALVNLSFSSRTLAAESL